MRELGAILASMAGVAGAALVVGVVSAAALVVGNAGCGTASTGGTTAVCAPVVPDGGNGGADAGLACDVAWSCSTDTVHHELQCSLMGGNFSCVCFTEGTVGNTFTVNPFACHAADAEPAATTGCGWTLM